MLKTPVSVLRFTALAVLAVFVLPNLPGTAAHGAPPEAEMWHRVMTDDGDGGQDYGGCPDAIPEQAQPSCPGDKGAMDLLALDVRETHYNGTAALVLRTIFQVRAQTHAGRHVDFAFKASGKDVALSFTGDGKTFTSTTCAGGLLAAFAAPGGDGTPQAVDCFVLEPKYNITAGLAVNGIVVQSGVDATQGDYMPGGWYASNGQPVPAPPILPETPDPMHPGVPDSPTYYTANMEPAPSYQAGGPATLVKMTSDATVADLAHGPVHITLLVASTLNLTAQFSNITLKPSPGIVASLDAAAVNLPNRTATRQVMLTVENATHDGAVKVTVTTDLGGIATLSLPVTAAPPPPPTSTTSSTTNSGKKTPGPELPMAGLAILGLVLVLRRRTPP